MRAGAALGQIHGHLHAPLPLAPLRRGASVTSGRTGPERENDLPGKMRGVSPRVYVTSRSRPGVGFGCLGSIMVGVLYLMAAVFFIVAVVIIAGAFLAAMVVALLALGVDRILLAINPKWRARRAARGGFDPVSVVTITSSRALDRAKPKRS